MSNTNGASSVGPLGDPTKVAMRVVAIQTVFQVSGEFGIVAEGCDDPSASNAPLVPVDELGEAVATVVGETIEARVDFGFSALSAAEYAKARDPGALEPIPAFRAIASFGIQYRIEGDDPVTPEDLRAFAEVNARMNAIPYWREFLHNSLARAGLPTYEVPPFNPMRLAQEAAKLLKGPKGRKSSKS